MARRTIGTFGDRDILADLELRSSTGSLASKWCECGIG